LTLDCCHCLLVDSQPLAMHPPNDHWRIFMRVLPIISLLCLYILSGTQILKH
jgi:hypothetical protein